MDQYHKKTLSLMLSAIPKLDLSQDGEAAAKLVNLSLTTLKDFERTDDLRIALRAIEALPQAKVSETAFASVLRYRNNVEKTLNLNEADEVLFRLKNITTEVVKDSELQTEARTIGEEIARRVYTLTVKVLTSGELTPEQHSEAKKSLNRVMTNYKLI